MIKDIEIENFRCFEHTKIEGFESINLIGGKNNLGKTALLEAILLNQSPQPKTIFLLRQLRQEFKEFSQAYPKKTWDNFFHDHQINKKIIIYTNNDKQKQQSINLEFFPVFLNDLFSDNIDIETLETKFQLKYFSDNYYYGSGLRISIFSSPFIEFSIISTNQHIRNEFKDTRGDSISQLQFFMSIKDFIKKTILLTPFSHKSQINITTEYSQAALNNLDKYILQIINSIDSSIKEIKIFCIGEPQIYLKRDNENYLPISMFGDAINRVTEIVVKILNNKNSILLIDEIENGIHYTNQRDFWKALFELSKELDVQIFATTHSLEMIQAFRDIGLKYYPDSGAYFEMARNPRTNKIVGIKHELEMLDYALKRNEEIRGE